MVAMAWEEVDERAPANIKPEDMQMHQNGDEYRSSHENLKLRSGAIPSRALYVADDGKGREES
jgi:hypothetical protein